MTYVLLKAVHVISVVIFLGNIITGIFWMAWAVRTKKLPIIHHAMHGIIVADRYFTIPGVMGIIITGILNALYAGLPLIGTGWIFYSIIMFSISGVIFGVRLAPLQKAIHRFTAPENEAQFEWSGFNRLYHSWDIWGAIAIITPLIALVLMVLKWPA